MNMESIQNTVIGTLESLKQNIEERDEAVLKREHVFSQAAQGQADKQASENAQDQDPQNLDKFKKVSYELLDIGLYYGQQKVQEVKSLPLYQKIDEVVHLDDKFEIIKKHGEQLYTMLDGKIRPIIQNVFFLYDQATNTVVSYVNVITDK